MNRNSTNKTNNRILKTCKNNNKQLIGVYFTAIFQIIQKITTIKLKMISKATQSTVYRKIYNLQRNLIYDDDSTTIKWKRALQAH